MQTGQSDAPPGHIVETREERRRAGAFVGLVAASGVLPCCARLARVAQTEADIGAILDLRSRARTPKPPVPQAVIPMESLRVH